MLKLICVLALILSVQAQADQVEFTSETQSIVLTGESLLNGEQPLIALKASESWITVGNEPSEEQHNKFALTKALKRADVFCQGLNYLQAATVLEEDLSAHEAVEGWILESSEEMSLVREERKISQLSWITLLAGEMVYRHPMTFNKITCQK